MNKYLSIIFATIFMAGCSDSGSSSTAGNEPEVDNGSGYSSVDFTVTQVKEFPISGSSQLSIQLTNLTSEDEVYLIATSSDMENNKLAISPSRTILYPTKGNASVLLDIQDLNLISQPEVIIEITTSSNSKTQKSINMEWAGES